MHFPQPLSDLGHLSALLRVFSPGAASLELDRRSAATRRLVSPKPLKTQVLVNAKKDIS